MQGRHKGDMIALPGTTSEAKRACGVRKERLFRESYAMCDAPQGHVQVKRPEMEYSYDDKIRPAQKAEMESGVGKIEIRFGTGQRR